jgi:hypothetical protein
LGRLQHDEKSNIAHWKKPYLSAGYGSLSLERLIHGSNVDPHAERKYDDLQVLPLEELFFLEIASSAYGLLAMT